MPTLTYLGRGIFRAKLFCEANDVVFPTVTVRDRAGWPFDVCAYYRASEGIQICEDYCARPAGEAWSRNWSWPGSVTDRTPYGVVCHELGHHCDLGRGERKGRYYSEYGESVMSRSGEGPITSYCPNPAEWFAEMFRLFVTNAAYLAVFRRKTYRILIDDGWKPISNPDWVKELGDDVPGRIVDNLRKKVR